MEFGHVSTPHLDLSRILQGATRRDAKPHSSSVNGAAGHQSISLGSLCCVFHRHKVRPMKRDQIKAVSDGLADVWRSAEQRRTEDIGAWLSYFFEHRRRLRASDTETPYSQGNPVLR